MKFFWDQLDLSYSTHGSQKSAANQKNREKIQFFRLNFEALLINRSSMKFHMVIAIMLEF